MAAMCAWSDAIQNYEQIFEFPISVGKHLVEKVQRKIAALQSVWNIPANHFAQPMARNRPNMFTHSTRWEIHIIPL